MSSSQRGMPSVAASSTWRDEDGVRQPAGDVHAWWPGTNQTLCGTPLSRARLDRFQHVLWADAVWVEGTAEPGAPVMALCHRCAAASRPRRTADGRGRRTARRA
ncbi:hypothetical protein [Lentzea californiensis]|uniref:hypothetical protein n=1 Tax=Lentzea californiensis TaxID=438851 RepID=UPI00216613D7|nr:hypothetical protein [Lentzea californiensis]MCR3750666.1 hypothetical protein [Lentzea californiensis]